MQHDLSLKEIQKQWRGSLKSYLIGFVSSLILTGISFLSVAQKLLAPQTLIMFIVSLAIIQAIIQARFFLHLGEEPRPQWESLVFYFMALVLLIVVIGSLWIMYDLHHRVMPEMMMGGHNHD